MLPSDGPGGENLSPPGRGSSPDSRSACAGTGAGSCSRAATIRRRASVFAQIVVATAAPRVAHRLALSARRGRGRRSGAGRVRQGVHAHRVVPAEPLVRGLVHANSDQRLSRSAEGAHAPFALDAAGCRRRPPRSGRHRARDAAERSIARSAADGARVARAARSPPCRSCPTGSAWCSCSATTPIIRRATSPR